MGLEYFACYLAAIAPLLTSGAAQCLLQRARCKPEMTQQVTYRRDAAVQGHSAYVIAAVVLVPGCTSLLLAGDLAPSVCNPKSTGYFLGLSTVHKNHGNSSSRWHGPSPLTLLLIHSTLGTATPPQIWSLH